MSTYRAADAYGDTLYPMTPAGPSRTLSDAVEWDTPFRVAHDGDDVYVTTTVDDAPYVPDVVNDPAGDVYVGDDAWTPLTGHTGQHGYRGAVMHPCEQLAGGLSRTILATPGVYVVTEVRDEDGDFPDGDPIGWAVLQLVEDADVVAGPYGVRQVTPATPGAIVCGTCGRAWDRDITPAGRCPWEDEHDDEPDRVSDADALDQIAALSLPPEVADIIRSTGREA